MVRVFQLRSVSQDHEMSEVGDPLTLDPYPPTNTGSRDDTDATGVEVEGVGERIRYARYFKLFF